MRRLSRSTQRQRTKRSAAKNSLLPSTKKSQPMHLHHTHVGLTYTIHVDLCAVKGTASSADAVARASMTKVRVCSARMASHTCCAQCVIFTCFVFQGLATFRTTTGELLKDLRRS